jgi:hypothetical protein
VGLSQRGGKEEDREKQDCKEEAKMLYGILQRFDTKHRVRVQARYWLEFTCPAMTIIQTRNTLPMIQNANTACQH